MEDVNTEIECINLRLELLNDESRRLYRLLDNFKKMKGQTEMEIRKTVLERLEKRKIEMKKELEQLTERVKSLV